MQSSYVNTLFSASQLQLAPHTLAFDRVLAKEGPRTALRRRGPEKRTHGRWTQQEKEAFEEALKMYGKDWKKVEAYVGTRSGTQIRSHAQKHFLKEKEKKHKTSHKANTLGTERVNTMISEVNSPDKIDVDKVSTELKDQDPSLPKKDTLRIEQLEAHCNSALQFLTSSIQYSPNTVQKLYVAKDGFAQVRQSALDALSELEDELTTRCRRVLDIAEFEIKEIDRYLLESRKSEELAAKKECPYLAERMAEFRLSDMEDVYRRYVKLGDWTDTHSRTIIRWTRLNSMVDMMIMREWAYRMGVV
eukprot:TRINITY_DN2061_c0_g1_i1.p1 TRINITY_DN2061_c0_g1~~TRINITY_DN2061_c0_g1_i1.p1  ORF type:complete len:303 (-),score=47.68 TRINITY_DN2061_c0_g1_i1:176-1084(-)